ncbi:hypothetical protein BCF74_101135 [Knoellia remsis]|uniref:WD40 repeat protein n=1 Tax=Knoellia remsis TaxID=407159 RepID=A0A2T0V0Q2_9MICO|nr:hypothetical protein [Knoellia remsis]PRY63736.1 hypothetical protein BCF74_101135 [Knoellia remsis]
MSPDLKALLDEAAAPIAERDFVTDAWEGARARRRRTRFVTAGVAAAAAAVVAAVVVIPRGVDDRRTLPATTPTPSASAPWQAEPVDVLGVDAVFGPTPEQAAALPRVDARTAKTLGLPESLNPDARDIRPLSKDQQALAASGDNLAPVSAVLLRFGTDGAMYPVLYRPSLSRPWHEVDTVRLASVTSPEGSVTIALGERAISPDRRSVALVQPDRVIIIDAVTATSRTIEVPDAALRSVGWTDDGRYLVAGSETTQWRVDPSTGRVTRFDGSAYAGRYRLSFGGGGATLASHAADGAQTDSRPAPPIFSGAFGETWSSGRFFATAGWLTEKAQLAAPTVGGTVPYQGVLVADAPLLDPRMLLVPDNPPDTEFSKGCCRPLRWVADDRLVLLWGDEILVWDVGRNELSRVSVGPRGDVTADGSPVPGSLSPIFAVAP